MTGSWLGLSLNISEFDLLKVLNQWFPDVKKSEVNSLYEAIDTNLTWPPMVYKITYNESEFPTVIDFTLFPGADDESNVQPVFIELSRRMAEHFECLTVCDGSGYGDIENYQGYSLIWNNGKSYLADDYGTKFMDEGDCPIKILNEIEVDKNDINNKYQEALLYIKNS